MIAILADVEPRQRDVLAGPHRTVLPGVRPGGGDDRVLRLPFEGHEPQPRRTSDVLLTRSEALQKEGLGLLAQPVRGHARRLRSLLAAYPADQRRLVPDRAGQLFGPAARRPAVRICQKAPGAVEEPQVPHGLEDAGSGPEPRPFEQVAPDPPVQFCESGRITPA
ncbi:hypothetical protein [Streptomyces pseudogriseolus]|uniref:hypothetical protein n=1 Tax=Streptomyces pseudogriseolus TaxID=36817 RepID=UPI003FA2D091